MLIMVGGAGLLLCMWIWGGLELARLLLPYIALVSAATFAVSLIVLLPLFIIPPTKGFGAVGLFVASYVFGLALFCYGILVTYMNWGVWGILAGLFLMGGGVVPVGVLSAIFEGQWNLVVELVVLSIVWFGSRSIALSAD